MEINLLINSLSPQDRNAIEAFLSRENEGADYIHSKNCVEYIEHMFQAYSDMYRRDAVEIDINGRSKKDRYIDRLGRAAEFRFSSDISFSQDGSDKLNAGWNDWLANQE